MKKKINLIFTIAISIIIIAIICLFSSFKYYNYDLGRHNSSIQLYEAKLNGHYYIIATKIYSDSGVSVIHSPNCKCNKK